MPLSQLIEGKRGLRNMCRRKLLDEVFDPVKIEHEWNVLVVDDLGMKIISSCFKTEEIMSFNIAIIEKVDSPARHSISYLSAIYIMYPSVQSCGLLLSDFVSVPPRYSSFHLIFLDEVPDEMNEQLLSHAHAGQVVMFREIDFLFLPYESQVFSLCDENFFSAFFDSFKDVSASHCASVARKLVSLFVVLKSKPRIRYRRAFPKNLLIAEAVHAELDRRLQSSDPPVFENASRPRCELFIVDRGFDCVSPVIHEFTLQAMAHDILDIQDDVYEPKDENPSDSIVHPSKRVRAANQVSLTEADPLWIQLRHHHIANMGKELDSALRTDYLVRKNQGASRFKALPELGGAVKKHLAFQKNQPIVIYRHMANACMEPFIGYMKILASLEQDLASGELSVEEAHSFLLHTVSDPDFSLYEKLRAVLQFIFAAKGVTKRDFEDLLIKAGLPFSDAGFITNVLHLDMDIFRPGECVAVEDLPRYSPEAVFELSKWVPAMKSLMRSCIEGKLGVEKYPYLDSQADSQGPARLGYWCADQKDDHVSRLIIFVAGGVTYSEMRCVYEVMERYKGWEIFIGGDTILTPNLFLDKLKSLRSFIYIK